MNRTERMIITIGLTFFSLASLIALAVYSWPFVFQGRVSGNTGTALSAFMNTLEIRVISTGVHVLTLLASGASISVVFRKSNYPEFSFFIFGLLSYAGIGIFNLPPILLLSGYPAPFAAGFIRLFYFFWCLGTISFFLAGLFPNGIPNLKQHAYFVITAVSSLAVVLLIPIDARQLLSGFPYVTAARQMLPWFIRCIAVLGVLNYIVAGIRGSSRKYMFSALGLLAVFAGNELFFFTGLYAVVFSPLLIISGTVLYSTMIYREYMWS